MRGGHHYMIGKSHEYCEDYSASCDTFAALSDGCSIVKDQDGNRLEAHTDVGARLLVRAAFYNQQVECQEEFHNRVLATASWFQRTLWMSTATLSATLLSLRVELGVIRAFVCGDGAVFGRHRTDGWVGWSYRFDGPPYYLRYRLCEGPSLPVTATSLTGQQERYDDPVRQLVFGLPDYDLVVAMSDGAFSFTSNGTPVPFDRDFAMRLLDFRRMGGKFMVRHLRGTLAELEREGIVNQDDLSMVALYAGD